MTIELNKNNIIDYTFNELFISYNGVIIVIDKKQIIEFCESFKKKISD